MKCVFSVGDRIQEGHKDVTILDVKKIKNKKYYKIKCNNCGFKSDEYYRNGVLYNEYYIEGSNLKHMKYCPCCCPNPQLVSTNINSIFKTDKWMIDLGVSMADSKMYTAKSNKLISVTCRDCGRVKTISINNLYNYKSIGCICSDKKSYISKYVFNLLNQTGVTFKSEVRYDWNKYTNPKNKKLSQASIDYVIYIDNREIPVEVDGEFHRNNNKMNGITKEQIKDIDDKRDANCLQYLNEQTIRISNEGSIKENILNSNLSHILDLSTINWDKCHEFALKNLVKEVCEYKNNNNEYTTTDIALHFGYSRETILKWLHKGKMLKWCDYNVIEERNKGYKKARITKGKPVEIYKDGVKLYKTFPSCCELERRSLELFNVKLNNSKISMVANGKIKTYKGFEFKYV